MRVSTPKIIIETGGEGCEESFAIGNLGFILSTLRDKMYSNPVKTICREISCNARDAHREVGTPELPIEIHLPYRFDSNFKIKDFGPGISPSRMSNVFIRYGNSTKNDSNTETGGFGLGAKTPFAYSDQFSIVTIVPEVWGAYNCSECGEEFVQSDIISVGCPECQTELTYKRCPVHAKRNYIAYIDASQEGRMRCVGHAEVVDEPCGTEIIIYVHEDDWYRFSQDIVEVTTWWDVHPNFTGNKNVPEYPEDVKNPYLEGDGWCMPRLDSARETSLAIVDRVAYPIDNYSVKTGRSDLEAMLWHGVNLYFDVGDLELARNREQLQYNNTTNAKIQERLGELSAALAGVLGEKLAACASLREAMWLYGEFKEHLGSALPTELAAEWQGHNCGYLKLDLNIDERNAKVYRRHAEGYLEGVYMERFRIGHNRGCDLVLKRDISTTIQLKQGNDIYLNDISNERVSRTRVRQALGSEEDKKYAFVITFSDGDVIGGLDRLKEANNKKVDLRLFGVQMLSSVILPEKQRKVKERKARGRNRGVFNAFKLNRAYAGHRSCDNCWEPIELSKQDPDGGTYVIVESHKKSIYSGIGNDTHKYSTDNVLTIAAFLGETIHGINSKDVQHLSSAWVPLHEALKNKYDAQLGGVPRATLREMRAALNSVEYRMDKDLDSPLYNLLKKNLEKFDNNNLVRQYYEASVMNQTEMEQYTGLWAMAQYVYPVEYNKKIVDTELALFKMKEDFHNTYPLLKWFNWQTPPFDAIFQYIGLIDKDSNVLDKSDDTSILTATA